MAPTPTSSHVKSISRRADATPSGVNTTSRSAGAAIAIVLSFLSTVTALLQTMVVPVLGKISADLEVSTAAVGWVVTVNLLAAAVLTPILSKFGDLHGRRRVLLWVAVAVAAGSLLAAVTSSFTTLLIARVVQGASFCIFPLSIGILRDSLDPKRLPLGMSLITGAISVGAGAGLVMTGFLTHGDRDYRNIFWFVLIVSLILLALAFVIIPNDRPRESGRVDWIGGILMGLGLVLLLLTLTQGSEWGWLSPATVGCFVGGTGIFAAWFWVEKRAVEPLVPMSMMQSRILVSTHLVGFFIGFGMFMVFLAVTSLVQTPSELGYGFSASVLQTSTMYLLPAALIGVVASPIGGMLVGRFGGRTTLLVGSGIGLLGYLQLATLHSEPWHVILGAVTTNAAFSMGFAAVPAVVVSVVKSQETAIANAVTSIARSAGSAVGSALVVTLVASRLMDNGYTSESTFSIIFIIGTISMALSIVIILVGLPHQRFTLQAAADAVNG